MKIVEIKLRPLALAFQEPYHWAGRVDLGAVNLLVEVQTDEGITGYGETIANRPAEGVMRMLEGVASLFIGQSPFDIERLFHQARFLGGFNYTPRFANLVLAGLEMALWDIIGKAAGCPVYQLLGGAYNDSVDYFGFVQSDSAEQLSRHAQQLVAAGYSVIYLKVGRGEERDLENVAAVRAVIGDRTIPGFKLFNQQQCEAVHLASLEILRRTGVRVYHEEALNFLRQTDAVITDNNLVHIPPGMVEWALAQAPARVVLCQRGSNQAVVHMEGMNVAFGPGSDCPNYLDPRTRKQRLFTVQDVIDCIRLVDVLPELGFCMSMGIPSDLDITSPYRHQAAFMMEHTEKPIVFISGDKADCEAIVAMATSLAGGPEALRLNPTLLCYSQITTPLQHGQTSTDKLLYMAEVALPIVHMPSPMMGATAPVTLAGALALGNAEVLSGLVIHQLKRAGAPFVYGCGLHHMDMKTTISVYGAPEFDLARVAVAEMARFYHLPHWGYAGPTDSCVLDEQAAVDATASILVALLSGQHLAHDIGYLEAGLTTSPEMLVFAAELISRTRHFMRGVAFDPQAMALDLIHEVGPGGDFLTTEHTLKNFRSHWQPRLFSRYRRYEWEEKGAARLGDRLREKTIALMESHRPVTLAGSLKDEIDYILRSAQG